MPHDHRWYVIRTRSRHEARVHEIATAEDAVCFFPQYRVLRVYQHRKVHRWLPMFPGYVFLYGDLDALYRLDRGTHTVGFLMVEDQRRLHDELCQIDRAAQSEVPCEPHPELRHGVMVRVSSGPFQGMQGMVDARLRRPDRLILQVGILGQAAALEIDADLLEVLEPVEA